LDRRGPSARHTADVPLACAEEAVGVAAGAPAGAARRPARGTLPAGVGLRRGAARRVGPPGPRALGRLAMAPPPAGRPGASLMHRGACVFRAARDLLPVLARAAGFGRVPGARGGGRGLRGPLRRRVVLRTVQRMLGETLPVRSVKSLSLSKQTLSADFG